MIAPTLWIVSVLMGTPVLGEYTLVKGSPPSEAGHCEMLSGIYGGEFPGGDTDLGNGLFTVFTNGTITAQRVDDFGIGTVLNLATGEPGSGDDGLWTDGIAAAAVEARYALFPQEFGFDVGLGYTRLFELAGSGFSVSGSGMVRFSIGSTWAWAFQCVDGSLEGEQCGSTPGQLNMDGHAFDACRASLLLGFCASGSVALSNSDSPGP